MWSRIKAWFGFGAGAASVEAGDDQLAGLLAAVAVNLDEITLATVDGDVERVVAARGNVLRSFEAMVVTVKLLVERLEESLAAEVAAEPEPEPEPVMAATAEPDWGLSGLDVEQSWRYAALMEMLMTPPERPSQPSTTVLLERLRGNENGNHSSFDDGGFWWLGSRDPR
jgi:hypothetical protein